MTRHTTLLTLTLAAFAATPSAAAQGYPLYLSVERAFGIGYTSATASSSTTVGGTTVTRETTITGIGVSLFGVGYGNAAASIEQSAFVSRHQSPRLALDYELPSHLTVGASAFVFYDNSTNASGHGTSTFGLGVAPRIGFSLALGDRLILWPRVGVSFSFASASPVRPDSSAPSTTSSVSYTSLSLNIEPTAVFLLARQFGITAGVVVDVPLVGTVTTTTTTNTGASRIEATSEGTLKALYLGLQFGVMGRF